MNSKERVIRALRFETPDRIPRDLWISPSAFLKHGQRLTDLLERHNWDINPGRTRMKELHPMFRKGAYTDEWGSVWRNLQDGILGEVVQGAIQSWSDLASFRTPEPEQIAPRPAAGAQRANEAFRLKGGFRFFERLQWLRTAEQSLLDLADQPGELFQLLDILAEYNHRQIGRLRNAGYDAIAFSEDLGSQRALLVAPALWREVFKPYYKAFFEHAHSAGLFVFFHSDGFILDIIDDLIEIGVDALNSQVWCMGVETLGERFRGKVTFWGELDRQSVVPHGTPEDIRPLSATHAGLPRRRHGRALIGQAEIDGLTPLENVEAILTAWD